MKGALKMLTQIVNRDNDFERSATDYLTCNMQEVIDSPKSASHLGRILGHQIKKWMREQPAGCRIFICISYYKVVTIEGHGSYETSVGSAFCAPANRMYEYADDFALEWVKYLKKYPQAQRNKEDGTVLHFCVCDCE